MMMMTMIGDDDYDDHIMDDGEGDDDYHNNDADGDEHDD